jgi:hypothetical protein
VAGPLEITSEVSGAASALAGLILVFFAAALSSFDGFDAGQQDSVRTAYRLRAWPAFGAFVLSVVSCGLALHAKATACEGTAIAAIVLLGIAGAGVFISALAAVLAIG